MTSRLRSGRVASFKWYRVLALARKDARELLRNPGAIVPPIVMVFGSLFPAFLVIVGVPMMVGETFEESGEFAEEAARAAGMIPELAGLSGNALVQTFLFHQFSLLLLLVPIVAAMALATHAVIGEKQSKALEPLLATPISTLELLAAKTMTPFLFALGLTWAAVMLYVLGAGDARRARRLARRRRPATFHHVRPARSSRRAGGAAAGVGDRLVALERPTVRATADRAADPADHRGLHRAIDGRADRGTHGDAARVRWGASCSTRSCSGSASGCFSGRRS